MLRIFLWLFSALLVAACVTTYNEPRSSEPRALFSGDRASCLFCNEGVWVVAVDGVPLSTNWKSNDYYVETGVHDILLNIRQAGLFGVCVVNIDVQPDENYSISHQIDGSEFVATVTDKQGEEVRTCRSGMRPEPSGGTYYVPMFIPTG